MWQAPPSGGGGAGSTIQRTQYYPSGLPWAEGTGASVQNKKYNGKEFIEAHGLDEYDSQARMYYPAIMRTTTIDPLAEKYYHISSYAWCGNNPVNRVDLDGMSTNPIYNTYGDFMGTDDKGLQGKPIVMNQEYFYQGMKHEEAMKKDLAPNGGEEFFVAIPNIENYITFYYHYNSLPNRPDYDGFISINEGIAWAKSHPGALKNPTPDNMLYIDAAKLNFGKLSVSNIGLKEGDKQNRNLFNYVDLNSATSRASTYALGNTQIQLLDSSKGTVKLFTDNYDWNYHNSFKNGMPQGLRDNLIYLERIRAGLDDSHGFPIVMYGVGTIQMK